MILPDCVLSSTSPSLSEVSFSVSVFLSVFKKSGGGEGVRGVEDGREHAGVKYMHSQYTYMYTHTHSLINTYMYTCTQFFRSSDKTMEHRVKQRSPEWHQLRRNVLLTTSTFADAVGVGKGKPFHFFQSRMEQQGSEEEVIDSTETSMMQHGIDMERIIKEAYELLTGQPA